MTLKLKELTLGVALASVSAGAFAYDEAAGRTGVHDGLSEVANAIAGRDEEGRLDDLAAAIASDDPVGIEAQFVSGAAQFDSNFPDDTPINTVDGGVQGGLSQLAAAISGPSGEPPVDPSNLPLPSDINDAEGIVSGVLEEEPEKPVRDSSLADGLAGSVEVTVSGQVNDALTCHVGTASNTDFSFPDMIADTGPVSTTNTVNFTVDCYDENGVQTNIYLTTNDKDPRSDMGSNVLSAIYTDNDGTPADVEVLVSSGDQGEGTAIGGADASYNSDGTGGPSTRSKTEVSLYATIETDQLGDGGSIAGGGDIFVWFD